MKIVSLLPSATEVICLLGLRDDLVGVTHECDFPIGVEDLPKVTKTLIPADVSSHQIDELVRERLRTQSALYTLDMSVLKELRPDLIVTQTVCDVCAVAEEEVRAAVHSLPGSPTVINLEPTSLDQVLDAIRLVGEAAGRVDRAEREVAKLWQRVRSVEQRSQSVAVRPDVVVLEWIDPPFSAGHWTPELVRLSGGREVIGREGERSQTMAWEDIVAADPDVLFIACCGYSAERTLQDIPILRSYPGWGALRCVSSGRVFVVDGSAYFSRPGPRLVDSLEILAHTFHPQLHPLPPGLAPAVKIFDG